MGQADLTGDEQEHQIYMGQLSSDTQDYFDQDIDHLELAQAKVGAEKLSQGVRDFLMALCIFAAIALTFGCCYFVTRC